MAHRPKTVVPKRGDRSPLWSALVLLAALVTFYGLLSVYMVRNHPWTDWFLQRVPLPTTRATLASDSELVRQIRVVSSRAWYTKLADQTSTLVAEATVVNDALVPVSKVVVEARARVQGDKSRRQSAVCGGSLSRRLFGRLPVEELKTLQELIPPQSSVKPGAKLDCQVAFARMPIGAEEVVLRIAWVEPLPGHPRPLFHPEG